MNRAVFIIKPAAIHNEKSIIFKLKSTGCIIQAQRSVRLTRQQAEEVTGADPYNPDDTLQLERINEYLQGPTTILIVCKYNVYSQLKSLLGYPEEILSEAQPEQSGEDQGGVEDAAKAAESSQVVYSPDGFISLYGNAFYVSQNEAETEKDVRLFFPDVAVFPPMIPGFDKAFLDNSIYPTLTSGLVSLCKEKPENPVAYLGQWLLDNNPNVPKVVLDD